MFSAASVCLFVCLFVCQHDNFRMSEHCTKISAEFEFEGHNSLGAHPPNMSHWATTLGKSAQAV